jgi:DNA-binding NarL/FixJ family response regulator
MQYAYETVIVERNTLVREGLARLLDGSQFRTVALFPHLDDVVLSALIHREPSLILVGVGEDLKTGIRTIECGKELQPTARIVVLAERPDASQALCAFRAGANAYLAEVNSCDALIKSLELVMLGETIFPFPILSRILDESRSVREPVAGRRTEFTYDDNPTLSAKESRILSCLADGSPNKVIARRVDIAESTVKVHVKAILRKIRVQNRTQAAIWAMNHGNALPGLRNGSSAPAKPSHDTEV